MSRKAAILAMFIILALPPGLVFAQADDAPDKPAAEKPDVQPDKPDKPDVDKPAKESFFDIETPVSIGPVSVDRGPFGGVAVTDRSGSFGVELGYKGSEWEGPTKTQPEARALVIINIKW